MRENVTISHRGAGYEIGRGRDCYGIWAVESSLPQPIEWWPPTPVGWVAAWTRFIQIEQPDAITEVSPPESAAAAGPGAAGPGAAGPGAAGPGAAGLALQAAAKAGSGARIATALIGVGVACGIAGLFPGYLGSASLASQAYQLVPHAIYLATWIASAVLIYLGGTRRATGALLGLGTSVVAFGFFLTDFGSVILDGTRVADAGLWLSLIGWLACLIGSAAGGWPRPASGLGRPHGRGHEVAPAVTLVLAGLGAAIAFVPPWDSFTLHTAAGVTRTVTQGYAFALPGPLIAGNVAVMVAAVAVIVIAGLWRPSGQGAALLAGATVPLVAQAISAVVQLGSAATPVQVGLTISSGLTLAFWIYCAFLVALALSCALLASGPDLAAASPGLPSPPGPAQVPSALTETTLAETTLAEPTLVEDASPAAT